MEAWRRVAKSCLGWLHPDEGKALRRYAYLAIDYDWELPLVEIGGYAGKSACWLGSVCQEKGTILYSVDWHRGSPEMLPNRECHHPGMIGRDGVFDSLPYFRANMRAAGLEDVVIPVVGRSETVGNHWETDISLLFIDGAHDGESVGNDYDWWRMNLLPGSYLLFHDTTIPEVDAVARRAVEEDDFELVEQIESLRVLRCQ